MIHAALQPLVDAMGAMRGDDDRATVREFLASVRISRGPVAMAAETWARAPFSYHRATILKLLRIDPTDRVAHFATAPFRIVQDDGCAWVAGAVGCPAHIDADAIATWTPRRIRSVILWNPKRDELRVMGEAASQASLILPDDCQTLTVYADGFSFFRAWAERRAEHAVRAVHVAGRAFTARVVEPADSLIPGALAIGDFEKLPWRQAEAETILPGPGVDPETLRKAVWRAYSVPRVIGDAKNMRKAA